MPADFHTLTDQLARTPGDWVLRLAVADELEAQQRHEEAYLARSAAWRWAWLEKQSSRMSLVLIDGTGRNPKHAMFSAGIGTRVELWLVWRADKYDTPGDWDNGVCVEDCRQGLLPWLANGKGNVDADDRPLPELPAVWYGDSLAKFCTMVEQAGGWWIPDFESAE